jgi:hypothetical protein
MSGHRRAVNLRDTKVGSRIAVLVEKAWVWPAGMGRDPFTGSGGQSVVSNGAIYFLKTRPTIKPGDLIILRLASIKHNHWTICKR